MHARVFLATLALAPMAAMQTAAAQQVIDFATCGPDLVACDENLMTACCYRDFTPEASEPKAIVIPMNRCHQQIAVSGILGPPPEDAPAWCRDPIGHADEGMYQAYGLVYRLQQYEIDLYWTINPTKDPLALNARQNHANQTWTERDIDLWILDGGVAGPPQRHEPLADCVAADGCAEPPVVRLNSSTLAPVSGSYTARQFPLRGSAFVIPPEQRARFDDFWHKRGEFAHLAGDDRFDFHDVDLYEVSRSARFVYQDYRAPGPDYPLFHDGASAAPVAMRLDFKPPRLARQSPAGVSRLWLESAKLLDSAAYPECLTGEFDPPDAVYCDITMRDIQAGYLTEGDFRWVWIDNWSDQNPCSNDALLAQHQKIHEYMTAQPGVRVGGNAMFIHGAVRVVEGCEDYELAGKRGVGISYIRDTPVDPFIVRRPQNLFMQIGDIPLEFASGEVAKWSYAAGGAQGYDPIHLGEEGTLVRLISEDNEAAGNALCTNHVSTEACDVFDTTTAADHVDVAVYFRHQSDPLNGVGFYLGGRQVDNRPVQLRMLLNAFISLPGERDPRDPGDAMEVARSSSIVSLVGEVEAQFQGTYLHHNPPKQVTTYRGRFDDDRFLFPYRLGHFRAIPTDQFSETSKSFSEFDPLFEAGDGIPQPVFEGCPTPFIGSCRTVFTNLEAGHQPERVMFDMSNSESLQPWLSSEYPLNLDDTETLISRVLAGYDDGAGRYEPRLGAVDRSTAAVIEPSPMVGRVRPTIAYVGAYDGMLHAICADTVSPCEFRGQVLWSFIPRTQLPFLWENRQRIDGSPTVADVFGDFSGDGIREWRTVLTLASGAGRPGFRGREPAVIALDVTDPTDPRILWELTSTEPEDVWGTSERGAVALGEGVNTAMGRVRIGGSLKNATFVQTNNGGIGEPGFFLAAIDTVSGELLWRQHHLYPEPREGDHPPVPRSGIPGGVAAIDREESGAITDLVVPSLYGDLWLVEAGTGANRLTGERGDSLASAPVLRFSRDYHPIGPPPTIYKDRVSGLLHAVVVSGGYIDPISTSWSPPGLDQFAVSVNLEDAAFTVDEDAAEFKINIGPNRAFAQAVVAGNELFIVTDSQDVNSSGYGTSGEATGLLSRFSLGGGQLDAGAQIGESRVIRGGAGSVDVTRDGVVYTGSGDGGERTDFSADFDADGADVEVEFTRRDSRILWARTQ
jgi:hypothetical protein